MLLEVVIERYWERLKSNVPVCTEFYSTVLRLENVLLSLNRSNLASDNEF